MGAPESNAGDDFHFWWAASRALALIQPGTEGRLLTVEGLSHLDDPDDQYEIVDVAEYLGGVTFDDATGLLVSQLKYSTRHPTRSWTAAQICRKRTRRQSSGKSERPRSVIADLAGTHRQLVEQYGRDAVLRKVRIRLVSNQPADPLLTDAISAAAQWVHEQGRPVRRADLLMALQANQATVVRTLATAVGDGLTSTAFCDFLTVLDMSLLGALDRAALNRQVRADTVQMSPGGGPDPSWRLFHLVREQAMPKSRRQGITAHDVLAALDVGDRSDLYPAPPRFVELPDPLPAPSAPHLAQAVMAHRGGTKPDRVPFVPDRLADLSHTRPGRRQIASSGGRAPSRPISNRHRSSSSNSRRSRSWARKRVSFGRYVVPHPQDRVVEIGTRLRRQAEPCVQCPEPGLGHPPPEPHGEQPVLERSTWRA